VDYVIRRISNRTWIVVTLNILIKGSAALWNAQIFLEIPELQVVTVMFVGPCVHTHIAQTQTRRGLNNSLVCSSATN